MPDHMDVVVAVVQDHHHLLGKLEVPELHYLELEHLVILGFLLRVIFLVVEEEDPHTKRLMEMGQVDLVEVVQHQERQEPLTQVEVVVEGVCQVEVVEMADQELYML
jgi:hypothetical protein